MIELERWLCRVFSSTPYSLEPASEDASFRRYFRLVTQEHSLIVMDAPPDKEDCRPFVDIAGMLSAAGLNVPQVVEANYEQGFLVLTDLGDQLYLPALQRNTRVRLLYQQAIDALVTMQAEVSPAQLPPYDLRQLTTEMKLFPDWLLRRHLDLSFDESALEEAMAFLADAALAQPVVFVHRDYHSRNLMVSGSGKPGILDFQDAMAGPVSYDLVSLLKDCYISWPQTMVDELLAYYLQGAARAGIETGDEGEFRRSFALMGVQRHLKASGIFARLCHRDGKAGFLADVPRTLTYIVEVTASVPELRFLGTLIEREVLPAMARVQA